MNRTLIERAKSMLLNASLQKEYWGEAIATAAYIINRSPTRSLNSITPEEQWTGLKPDLSHMKVFGCQAMVHIPKEKRRKLDAKSRNLTFIGYSECTKGYRFIDKKTKQVTISRDAVFLEDTVSQNKVIKRRSIVITDKQLQESVVEKDGMEEKNSNTFLNKSNHCSEQKGCMVYLETDSNQTHTEQGNCDSDSDNSSIYDDPNDETYIPAGSFNTDSPKICHVNLRPRRGAQRQTEKAHNDNSDPMSFLCINSESAMSLLDDDPQNHTEALNCENSELWKQAMETEYQSLIENNTWSVIDPPVGKKIIPCKWVFKTKRDDAGNIKQYKARLVIKGFKQTKGIDYNEVYAPVVRYSSIRYLIGLASKYKLKIHQMDAISAFLQGVVEEEIYMSLPPCYENENKVCRLNKALYGLKQASRQWNIQLNAVLIDIGLKRSTLDPCIYYRIVSENDVLFIAVYVDDLLYMYNNDKTALFVKTKLKEHFKMKDLGTVGQCIGFKVRQNVNMDEISLDQTLYIEKILQRFKMFDCKPVPTPFEAGTQLKKAENETEVLKNVPYQEAVGCLLYLSQGTRPDIAYAVNTVSRFNNNPTMQHWIAVKRIFRYLKGTIDMKLTFKKDDKHIVGYCDADWASDIIDRRSCTGYLFIFQGACISWNSRKQATVALSSTEAEYMSLASATQEAIWLKQLHDDIWHNTSGTPIAIYCDNRSAISLSGSHVYHARSKHIDVRYNFVKEKVAAKQINVQYISTEFMLADALTKGLPRPKLCHLTAGMGLRSGEGVGMNAVYADA